MSILSRKIIAFAKKVSDLTDKPGGTVPAAQLKSQFDASSEELRVAHNGLIDDINAEYATKAELSGIQLGQITDGTVTPAKLSFDPATQSELDAHTGATTGIHGATSAATANTLAFRDASGRLQVADPAAAADAATKGYADATYGKIASGTYVGTGASVVKFVNVGFTPKLVHIIGSPGGTSYDVSTITPQYAVRGTSLLTNNGIVTNGFNVYDYTNTLNVTYSYVAEG